ncbi:MAG: UDP-N-acetylglucosamine diphosphorylase/glucosamine-1-phosphate N-acetyltransferase [bacterium]|nr:UDP-N-acetylglucosamine diphosphorylase/glucosamine-1-phosphate N-acetyltransferase [bacterium]
MPDGIRDIAVVILAAGQGTRMKSRRAKVLHDLCGRSILEHVVMSAEALEPSRLVVVVGRDAEVVEEAFRGRADFVRQEQQRGTGHAVIQALPLLDDHRGDVLVLYGDTPLLRIETLEALRALKAETGVSFAMLTCPEPLPGRVVRNSSGAVERIVEMTDASAEELEIQEGNTGVYLLDCDLLSEGLSALSDDNAQGEFYLTDVVGTAVEKGHRVEAMKLENARECLGINTRAELAQATAELRERTARRLMAGGVTLVDPDHTYIDADVEIGPDTVIEPGCVIRGSSVLGAGVHVKSNCTIEDSRLDDDVVVGPSAHLRPGTHLMERCRIGNFVEVKNSILGPGVKADHLSYIGDADVGAGSSFGCGSITVNYDGLAKHRTRLGEGVFVGCNANLIAPVTLEDGSFVAAGSTVTTDVSADSLAVARSRQREIKGWAARRRGASAGRNKD